jgi:hypothetical protein
VRLRLVVKEKEREADMAATRERERLARESNPDPIIPNPVNTGLVGG